jgi:N-methylhydantoinase B
VKTYRITGPCRLNLKIERTKCPPWGLAGGGEAKPADVEIRRADGETLRVLKGDHELRAGDEVVIRTGGGGGYGPARERDPEKVRQDVESGYVSVESARDDYFVVIAPDGRVDVAATTASRKQAADAQN